MIFNMNDEYNENMFIFNHGDTVRHKGNNLTMVVIETKNNYAPPNNERIVCSYWDTFKEIIVIDEFYPSELETIKRK